MTRTVESNKRKHDAVMAALFHHDDKEKLGIHKKRNISPATAAPSSFQQQAGVEPPQHQVDCCDQAGQCFWTDTIWQELARLRDMRRQVFQLQLQPQQQQQQSQLLSLCFHQALHSMQRFPHVAVVQCLGLHILRQLVLCCTSSSSSWGLTKSHTTHLLLLLPRRGRLGGVLWEATLHRTLSDPVLQRDAAVQRAATALTACCLSETTSCSQHHFEITPGYMITALTQILQCHASDPVIQCNATATLCHLLMVVQRRRLRSPTNHRHNPTIVERQTHRPLKETAMFDPHKKSHDLEIQTNDPNDADHDDDAHHADGAVRAALGQLPLIVFESLERHLNEATIFGNCVVLLTLLQHQQLLSLPESPSFSAWSLPQRIRQGMQRHTDSLPIQHASLRWLRLQLQLQLHHHSSNSNSGSSTRWTHWLLTVFPSVGVSQVMQHFPNAVALQVCATQVLTLLQLLNRTEHQGHTNIVYHDDDTARAAVWQALRRHPQALQLPSAAYFAVQYTTTTAAAATRAFGGDPEHPWTVLQHVWQRLGLLSPSTSSSLTAESSVPEPNHAAAAAVADADAAMVDLEDEEP